jgi:tetratricopeptide (TPR) repeat protein
MTNNSIIIWVRYWLYLTLVFAIPSHSTFAICEWKNANSLVDTYGKIEPEEDNKVAKAHEIFERVRAVASTDTLPTLVVIKSKNKPWAVALPKNHLVLSQGALEVIYQHATQPEIEVRLAFVLGHELAHLAHDDFLQLNVRMTGNCFAQDKPTEEAETKELAADQKGFIYAAMAGYDVGLLLKSSPEKPNFLVHWIQQINPSVSSQVEMEKRATLLNQHLQEINDKILYFKFGVRLAHFEQCKDAVYFLEAFKNVFWSREVLNNLGVCDLQLARQEMESEQSEFYWMPTVLDTETQLAGITRSAGTETSKMLRQIPLKRRTKDFLEKAKTELEQAVKADQNYAPARINLAVIYLYLGKPSDARGRLEEAKKLMPNDLEIQGLIAIALYEGSEIDLDLWPPAVKRLEDLASQPAVPWSVIFNLARLLELRPRSNEAYHYWNRLASQTESLPATVRNIVCKKLTQSCKKVNRKQVGTLPWRWSIPFERTLLPLSEQPQTVKMLKSWGEPMRVDFSAKKLRGHIYQSPDQHTEVLELDGYVVMQVLRGDNLATTKELSNYCGQPVRKRTIVSGHLWSCDRWTALELQGQIREVWTNFSATQ